MNKCLKIAIKNCKELPHPYQKTLKELRYESWLASNLAMTHYYSFTTEKMQYKQEHGTNLDEKERFGKTHRTWVYHKMREIMVMHSSGNVSQTNEFISNRFKDDIKKGLYKGQVSLSNFKQTNPIIIRNDNFKISQGNKGFEIICSLFNASYQKANDIKRVTFGIDKLDNYAKAILNRIILGVYKQGSMQIQEDRNGKWFLTISFNFETSVEELDMNKTVGVDLGLVNTAVMQVFDSSLNEWIRTGWKHTVINGKEIMYFRQKLDARRKQMQIAGKIVGQGRIGRGYKTKMRPSKAIGSKVDRYKDTYNHKVSKYIVDFALRHKAGTIQMEDLSGFSGQQSETFLKNWTYHDLQSKVEYKCEEKGIKFVLVNPEYTSKRCSHCGCIDDANRDCKVKQDKFECVVCGFKENADINAARNISIPEIDQIIKDSISRAKTG